MVSEARQIRPDLRKHRHEKPHRCVPRRLGEGGLGESLGLRELDSTNHWRLLFDGTADRSVPLAIFVVRNDEQQGARCICMPRLPEIAHHAHGGCSISNTKCDLQRIVPATIEGRDRLKPIRDSLLKRPAPLRSVFL